MPVLYLVGTPIGNLEDISLRALRVLRSVTLIAAEDTRTTGRLLKHFQIETPLVSYHEYSGPDRVQRLVEVLTTGDIALVSDAGMPGLSDPGFRLIKAAVDADLQIIPVPGPTAAIAALVSSGLPTDRFLFLGFLPRQRPARQKALAKVAPLQYTLVIYEAPHRLLSLLADLKEVVGDRRVSISREMTKLHEETWRGSVAEAMAYFGVDKVRGEFTLIVEGASSDEARWDERFVRQALVEAMSQGASRKEAAAAIARLSGWRKRDVYDLTLYKD
jgi:16S rRNA (cytidine1402-2'-O)-methyltransferase